MDKVVKDKVHNLLDELEIEKCTVAVSVFSDFFHLTCSGDEFSLAVEKDSIMVDMENIMFTIEFSKVTEFEEYETEYGRAILLKSNNGNLEISGV